MLPDTEIAKLLMGSKKQLTFKTSSSRLGGLGDWVQLLLGYFYKKGCDSQQ